MSHVRAELPHDLRGAGVNVHPGSADDGWRSPPPVILGDGTLVQLLKDGEALAAAYQAIEAAKYLICLEVYIFGSDRTGRMFADLLCRKAAAGVRVFVIFDSFGSFMSDRAMFEQMRRSGVRVEEFHPVRPWELRFSWRPFNRDHRKLVVVDHEVAWLGGLNIGDEYAGPWLVGWEALDVAPWRDTAIGLRGPAGHELFRVFRQTWNYLQHGGRIGRCERFQEGEHYDIIAPVACYGSKLRRRFAESVRAANRSIQLTMAYFAPDDALVEELCKAARRGVRVQLMIPAKSDLPLLTTAARSFYETLMHAGVEVYERQHVILHSKTMVVDGRMSIVGSTNLDYRSIEYNCELSVVIHSPEFGEKMDLLFQNDVAYAQRIDPKLWRRRPMRDRLVQWAVSRARYLL